jgi:hypothetical protein
VGRGCADGRAARWRTVKTRGPGAPRLAPSVARLQRPREMTVTTTSRVHRGDRVAAVQTTAQGRPECFCLYLWSSRARAIFCAGAAGAVAGTGLPCALFTKRAVHESKTRAKAAAGTRSRCLYAVGARSVSSEAIQSRHRIARNIQPSLGSQEEASRGDHPCRPRIQQLASVRAAEASPPY